MLTVSHQIELHSESSFTITCPEIIWFYCINPPMKNLRGDNTDSKFLGTNSPFTPFSKTFFLKNPITFHNKIKINNKKYNEPEVVFKSYWLFDEEINWKKGLIHFKYTKFLVHKNKYEDKFVFVNHLLSVKQEDQIYKCTYNNNKLIPKKIMKEIYNKIENLSFHLQWEKGDMIMINNKRFIHGRSK